MTRTCGLFVTIEGIEGAGKSTLGKELAQWLSSQGREVVLTREPGGTAIGDGIRRMLLESTEPISNRTELLLFEASRAQHVDHLIGPALERGAVVVCDRFADSSLAYQSDARGIDAGAVTMLTDFATAGLRPDITILLDLPAPTGLGRQRGVDRISSEGIAFHESVRQGYLAIAKQEPGRFVVLDATKSADEVLADARRALEEALGEVEG